MLPNLHFSIERWRKNEEYGVWVSTHGRIRLIKNKDVLNPRISQSGYCVVFTDKGREFVHRLVAYTWLGGKRNAKYNIDHINSNKRDNSVRNLRWIEVELNQDYAKYTSTPPSRTDTVKCIEQAEREHQLVTRCRNGDVALIATDINSQQQKLICRYDDLQQALHAITLPKKQELFATIETAIRTGSPYNNYTWQVREVKDE